MGGCLRKIRKPSLDQATMIDLIEATQLNQNVLQGWYEEFIQLFPEGFAQREKFVKLGSEFLQGGDSSEPEALMEIIFNFLADEADDQLITFDKLAKFLSVSLVGSIDDKIKLTFDILSNKQDHFTFESFNTVLEALRKMRSEDSGVTCERELFDLFSGHKPIADLQTFSDVIKQSPQKIREIAANFEAMRAAPIRVYV